MVSDRASDDCGKGEKTMSEPIDLEYCDFDRTQLIEMIKHYKRKSKICVEALRDAERYSTTSVITNAITFILLIDPIN